MYVNGLLIGVNGLGAIPWLLLPSLTTRLFLHLRYDDTCLIPDAATRWLIGCCDFEMVQCDRWRLNAKV